jgi:hypothetical protein
MESHYPLFTDKFLFKPAWPVGKIRANSATQCRSRLPGVSRECRVTRRLPVAAFKKSDGVNSRLNAPLGLVST